MLEGRLRAVAVQYRRDSRRVKHRMARAIRAAEGSVAKANAWLVAQRENDKR